MSEERMTCVVTSINPPTEAMLSWTRAMPVLVVPDRRTPTDRFVGSAVELLPSSLTHGLDSLRHDHYSRKMIGYLEAMSRSSEMILDTDDDTYLKVGSDVYKHEMHSQKLVANSDSPFVNMFALRLPNVDVWPRGFPLDEIRREGEVHSIDTRNPQPVSVVQFLIDGDTDVDAVHRLVFGVQDVRFVETASVDIVAHGQFCPFNSQLTLWRRAAFPLLYLPSFVSFRFTDILRGVVAKRVLDANNLTMGFADSVGFQVRNDHSYISDFESEIPCYLHTRLAWDCLEGLEARSIADGLVESYRRLVSAGVCTPEEIQLVGLWLESVCAIDDTICM